jgi:hypothetical protein
MMLCVWDSMGVYASDLKLTGIQFSLGQPADKPAARVAIAEITQGAQKRGFLRIALLPLVLVRGVEVRFSSPDLSVLGEIQSTLKDMVKLDAQEWHALRLFVGSENMPRLTAEEVTPKGDIWELKRVYLWSKDGMREIEECTLRVSGGHAGQVISKGARTEGLLDLETHAP